MSKFCKWNKKLLYFSVFCSSLLGLNFLFSTKVDKTQTSGLGRGPPIKVCSSVYSLTVGNLLGRQPVLSNPKP